MAILTKDITLGYKAADGSEYTVLTNLQEVPEIGNGAPEKIEVTVLTDNVKKYIAGLGDSGQDLSFKFIYVKEQMQTLIDMAGETFSWQVSMPDGVTATFDGVPAVKFDSASPNNAITYTLTIVVESEILFA
jgi:hypothetical protein